MSGFIETADSFWSGSDYNVRHTITRGGGLPPVVAALSSSSLDDLDPRLAIGSGGDTWVAWWRDDTIDEVLMRKRSYSTGVWDSTHRATESTESGRHPRVVFDGSGPWLAYEATGQGGIDIIVRRVLDDPEPFGVRVVLATTGYTGTVDVALMAEAGHLWVTWVDSGTNVGWCEYDYGTATWSTPANESYANDTVQAARGRIRSSVLEE